MFVLAWGGAVLPAVVFTLLLLVPGGLVLLAVGASPIRALVCAPIVSVALVGLGGVVLWQLRIAWSIGSFVLLSVFATGAALLVRIAVTRRSPWRVWRSPRVGAWGHWLPSVAAGIVLSAVAVSIQYLKPIGAAQNITYNYDAVWHYDVIRHILSTGDASSLDVGRLDGTAGSHYYPDAWHSLVAITIDATGASLPAAVNASIFVLFAFVWPLSAAVLAARLFGSRRLLVLGTIVAAPLFAAFPTHFLDFGPLYSNLLSFAVLPGSVAVFVELLDRWDSVATRRGLLVAIVVVIATFIGTLFAQPNSVFTLFVIVLPLIYVVLFRTTRRQLPTRRWAPWLLAVGFTCIWIAAWVVVHDSAPLRRTVSVVWPATLSAAQAFGEFILQGTEGSFPELLLVILIGIGITVIARNSRLRWIAVSYAILGGLYVVDAGNNGGPGSLRDYATGFWYHDSVRLAAAIVLIACPLAGLGFQHLVSYLSARASRRTPGRWASLFTRRSVAVAAAVGLVVVSVGADHALVVRRASLHDSAVIDQYQMLNPQKVKFLHEVASTVDPGVRIANDPDDGSGFAYSIFSLPVMFAALPGNWIGSVTDDQRAVLSGLNTLGRDPSVCAVVARQHLGYVMALSAPRTLSTPRNPIGYSPELWRGVRVDDSTVGFEKILGHGGMALYKITGCG